MTKCSAIQNAKCVVSLTLLTASFNVSCHAILFSLPETINNQSHIEKRSARLENFVCESNNGRLLLG